MPKTPPSQVKKRNLSLQDNDNNGKNKHTKREKRPFMRISTFKNYHYSALWWEKPKKQNPKYIIRYTNLSVVRTPPGSVQQEFIYPCGANKLKLFFYASLCFFLKKRIGVVFFHHWSEIVCFQPFKRNMKDNNALDVSWYLLSCHKMLYYDMSGLRCLR